VLKRPPVQFDPPGEMRGKVRVKSMSNQLLPRARPVNGIGIRQHGTAVVSRNLLQKREYVGVMPADQVEKAVRN